MDFGSSRIRVNIAIMKYSERAEICTIKFCQIASCPSHKIQFFESDLPEQVM